MLTHFSALSAAEGRLAAEVDVWAMMAGSAEALGQMRDAVAYYDRALALAPDDVALARARAGSRRHLTGLPKGR